MTLGKIAERSEVRWLNALQHNLSLVNRIELPSGLIDDSDKDAELDFTDEGLRLRASGPGVRARIGLPIKRRWGEYPHVIHLRFHAEGADLTGDHIRFGLGSNDSDHGYGFDWGENEFYVGDTRIDVDIPGLHSHERPFGLLIVHDPWDDATDIVFMRRASVWHKTINATEPESNLRHVIHVENTDADWYIESISYGSLLPEL